MYNAVKGLNMGDRGETVQGILEYWFEQDMVVIQELQILFVCCLTVTITIFSNS